MTSEKKHHGINVLHLNYYNAFVLIVSTLLFVFSVLEPRVDPYYILLVAGGLVLLVSYSITAASYYRLLFTADPQKISMLTSDGPRSHIAVFPYILDKRTISVYVSFITFNLSPNYRIVRVTLNGNSLSISSYKNDSYEVKVDEVVSTAARFEIDLEVKEINLTSRFFVFCLFYSKRKRSRFLIFKEIHYID
ncbi:MAG: hypothetical protein AAE986_06620 [Thermoplasmataceae archaeon]|jgi:hypothetical protein